MKVIPIHLYMSCEYTIHKKQLSVFMMNIVNLKKISEIVAMHLLSLPSVWLIINYILLACHNSFCGMSTNVVVGLLGLGGGSILGHLLLEMSIPTQVLLLFNSAVLII